MKPGRMVQGKPSIALVSDNREEIFSCEDSVWQKLLDVTNWNRSKTTAPTLEQAEKWGLLPYGRSGYEPVYGNWQGGYTEPRGQHVDRDCAKSLGDAWERKLSRGFSEDWITKERLEEFIRLCRSGGFTIR